ncbi:MAG TPA: endonuclease/exonuclease/phosphatase family protein [Kofleriaceae bacterium]|nr:endonuclease/exonuclease/phosphatase family protein [Kofleriaceae bacterium]
MRGVVPVLVWLWVIGAGSACVVVPVARSSSASSTAPAAAPRARVPGGPCRGPALVVVTYNVRFDTPADHKHNWKARRERVGEQIRSLGADLVGLQEVEANQLDDLGPMLPGYAHEGVGRDDGVRGGQFEPLYYSDARFTREDGGTFWLSPTPERPRGRWEFKPWGSWQNRIATWVLLRDHSTGRRVLAVNTHFDHYSEMARRESARMLVDFAVSHPADDTIVLGDLNARRGSRPYRMLARVLRDAATAPSVEGPASGTSVTAWTRLGAPHHHIDHIFVSPALRPLTYQVIDRRFRYAGGDLYPSDHLPVRASLCVEPIIR